MVIKQQYTNKIDWTVQKKLFDWTTFRWKSLLCLEIIYFIFMWNTQWHAQESNSNSNTRREDINRIVNVYVRSTAYVQAALYIRLSMHVYECVCVCAQDFKWTSDENEICLKIDECVFFVSPENIIAMRLLFFRFACEHVE